MVSKMFDANSSVSNISTFGFAQKMGESGVLGFAVMNMNFGDIEITTVDLRMEVLELFLQNI